MKYNSLKLLCNILLVTGIGTLFLSTSSVALFGEKMVKEKRYSYNFGSPWAGDGGPPEQGTDQFSYDFGNPWAGDGGPPEPGTDQFSYDFGNPWAGDGFKNRHS